MPTSSSGRPTRACRSAAWSMSSRATSEPTVPQPSRATRSGGVGRASAAVATPPRWSRHFCLTSHCSSPYRSSDADRPPPTGTRRRSDRQFILPHGTVPVVTRAHPTSSAQQVVEGLPPQQGGYLAVPDRDHRRPRHVVVVAGHRPAVRARWPARRAGHRGRCRRAGTRPGPGCRRPRSACPPPGRGPVRPRNAGRPGWRSTPRRTGPCGCCRSSRRRRPRRAGWRRRRACTCLTVPTR